MHSYGTDNDRLSVNQMLPQLINMSHEMLRPDSSKTLAVYKSCSYLLTLSYCNTKIVQFS